MDARKLTLGEIEEIERRARLPIRALDDPDKPQGTLYRAVAFVVMRRSDPALSWETTATLTMEEMQALLKGDDTDDSPLGVSKP